MSPALGSLAASFGDLGLGAGASALSSVVALFNAQHVGMASALSRMLAPLDVVDWMPGASGRVHPSAVPDSVAVQGPALTPSGLYLPSQTETQVLLSDSTGLVGDRIAFGVASAATLLIELGVSAGPAEWLIYLLPWIWQLLYKTQTGRWEDSSLSEFRRLFG